MRTTSKQQPGFLIRWAIRRDISEMLMIGAARDREELIALLRRRDVIAKVVEMPADSDGYTIAGLIVYSLHKTHFGILDIAVRYSMQRQGVASLLIDKMKGKLSKHRPRLEVIVPEGLQFLDAQLFFSSQGFAARCREGGGISMIFSNAVCHV